MSDQTRPDDVEPDPDEEGERWDADDPRRQKDCFAPPAEPCECYCLHCQRAFMSDLMWFQKVVNSKDGFDGFWMCPTPNCGGCGFTFDIFPTDPDHPANAGWHYCDDDEEEYDEEGNPIENPEYNPDEPKYKQLDEEIGDEDDDIEGEEWKHGLAPGEQLPEPEWVQNARKEWEEEQKRYDEPDLRPRELDWSDREQRGAADIRDEDIPF